MFSLGVWCFGVGVGLIATASDREDDGEQAGCSNNGKECFYWHGVSVERMS
jgi:hypothetical protein